VLEEERPLRRRR
jgi:hypothetical protein